MKISQVDVQGYNTLLLDRDGTINVHIIDDYVRRWEDFEFIPGVLESIACWTASGKSIYIVTNQRCIGKGLITEEELSVIHSKMIAEIEKAGGRVNGIYFCPSLTEEDIRRKPGRGMFDEIIRCNPEIDTAKTLMIGDGDVDRDFAKNCGIDFVRVDSLKRKGNKTYWVNS